jgi:hypothetical protein
MAVVSEHAATQLIEAWRALSAVADPIVPPCPSDMEQCPRQGVGMRDE